jgi:rfaE bifunctional protein nucleotidyltransferase chain/domain
MTLPGSAMTSRSALRARLDGLDGTQRVVLANGCFDLLHPGHIRYLEDARSRGDLLIVALNSDASVRAIKGPGRPFMALPERAEVVGALRCVDAVTWFDEHDLEATLRELRPDVHAKGSDYTPRTVPEAAIDRELGIAIAICGDAKDHSTTDLVARITRSATGACERP